MPVEAGSPSNAILSPTGFTSDEHPQNVPVSISAVDPSSVPAGSSPEVPSLIPKDDVSQSNPKFDHLQDRNPAFTLKTFPNAVSTEASQANSAKPQGDFATAQSFHPPAGSRLLAFARMQPKAVPNVNQATTLNGMWPFLFKGFLPSLF